MLEATYLRVPLEWRQSSQTAVVGEVQRRRQSGDRVGEGFKMVEVDALVPTSQSMSLIPCIYAGGKDRGHPDRHRRTVNIDSRQGLTDKVNSA
jgi:hypothetical protein